MVRFLLISFLLIAGEVASAQNEGLTFSEKAFNFGKIKEENGYVSHSFLFENRGKKPVVISSIATGCGCTTTDYPKYPILQGKREKIVVRFDPSYRSGIFSKEIVIITSDSKTYRIWIKGDIEPSIHPVTEDYPYRWNGNFYTSLKVLSFGEVAFGKSKTITLGYANDTKSKMDVAFVLEGNIGKLELPKIGGIKPLQRGKIDIKYTRTGKGIGQRKAKIYIIINGHRNSQSYIEVKASDV